MSGTSESTEIKKYIFCNRCRNETNHILKAEHYRDYPDYFDGVLAYVERIGFRFGFAQDVIAGHWKNTTYLM